MSQGSGGIRVRPNKGIHLVVPRARLGIQNAVAFRATDGRRDMYATPWRHTCLIGTTDADDQGDPDALYASGEEVRYVLDSTRRTFPAANLQADDILSTFAGVRPLLADEQASAYRTAREHRVAMAASGLISIAGGKLTTYRRMAQETVDQAARQLAGQGLERRTRACQTGRVPLDEALAALEGFTATAAELGPEVTAHLLAAYGSRGQGVLAMARADSGLRQRIVPDLPYTYAEVAYGVEHEMALTLSDVMARRLRLIHEDRQQGLACAEAVAGAMGAALGWTRETVRAQVAAYQQEVALSRRYLRE
jgi:glycerol-3-phosphate dehydrogenase